MRIAVFLTSYQIGGVEKVFFTLLNEWAKLGHNVYAYVLRNGGRADRGCYQQRNGYPGN